MVQMCTGGFWPREGSKVEGGGSEMEKRCWKLIGKNGRGYKSSGKINWTAVQQAVHRKPSDSEFQFEVVDRSNGTTYNR